MGFNSGFKGLMKLGSSLPQTQKPATFLFPEPDEYIPRFLKRYIQLLLPDGREEQHDFIDYGTCARYLYAKYSTVLGFVVIIHTTRFNNKKGCILYDECMCFLYNFCNCSLVSNVSYLTFKWLLYAPPGLTLKRAAFCTTSVFMCFLYNFCNCSLVSNVSYLTFKWLLYAPPGLTLKNSTFCPHTVFMCFVWISEQTAIISLYRIN